MRTGITEYAEKILMGGGKIYIYGCGRIGKKIEALLRYNGIETKGYIVSNGQEHADKENGVKVFELSDLIIAKEDGIIIGFDSHLYGGEIMPRLLCQSYGNLYFLVWEDKAAIKETELSALGVDVTRDILDIGKFRIPNIFKLIKDDPGVLRTTIDLLIDLVFPYLNDYSQVDEGPYEYQKVVLEENDVVIDCGANIGLFSARASALGCKTYAFEPNPDVLKYLNMMNKYNKNNIEIVPYAVGKEVGSCLFSVEDGDTTVGNIIGNTAKSGKSFEIKQTSLDAYVEERRLEKVDFIKADVEGAERLMLEGARGVLKRYAPKLSLCTYHLYDDVSVLTDLILDANPDYKIKYAWKKLYAWVE